MSTRQNLDFILSKKGSHCGFKGVIGLTCIAVADVWRTDNEQQAVMWYDYLGRYCDTPGRR